MPDSVRSRQSRYSISVQVVDFDVSIVQRQAQERLAIRAVRIDCQWAYPIYSAIYVDCGDRAPHYAQVPQL